MPDDRRRPEPHELEHTRVLAVVLTLCALSLASLVGLFLVVAFHFEERAVTVLTGAFSASTGSLGTLLTNMRFTPPGAPPKPPADPDPK